MIQNASYFRLVTKIIQGVPAAGGNAGTDFTFDDQPDLRYARLQGIVAFSNKSLGEAQPSGTPLMSFTDINKVSFVFQTNDPDDLPIPGAGGRKSKGNSGRFTGTLDTIQWMPMSMLHVFMSIDQPGGVITMPPNFSQMVSWKDRYIVWQKSHIKIATGGLANQTDLAICLGVFYTFIDDQGKEISPRN